MDSPEKLGWDLSFDIIGDGIRDAISGLKNLVSGLAQTREKLSESDKAAGRFIDAMGKMREANGRFVEGVRGTSQALSGLTTVMGGVATAAAVMAAAVAAGVKLLDAYGDKAIKAFGERGSAIRAYTTLLGDAKQAELEFYKAQQLAARTDLTAEATQKAQQQLLVAGFRGQDKDATLLAGLDLASISPGDKNEALKSFARATAQIKQKGKLQQEELLQLAEGASLGTGFVKSELVKILGVKDTDAVDKKQKKGEITADQGLLAIQRAVLAQLGTQKLGEYATGSSGTLTGLLSNRDEAFDNLLKSFDSEVLPGVQRYKDALKSQGEVMDVTTEKGQSVVLVMQDLANTSLSLKSSWTEFTTGFAESFSKAYNDVMAELGINQKGLDELSAAAKRFGEVIGKVVGPVIGVFVRSFEYIAPVINAVSNGIEYLSVTLSTLGEVIADLLAGDIKEVRADLQRLRNSYATIGAPEDKSDAARKKERESLNAYFDSAPDDGGVVQGGGGGVASPYGPKALKNFGGYKLKGAGGSSKGGGGKGGGGGGGGGLSSYVGYDYGPLSLEGGGLGASLPAASIGAMQSQAEAALLPTIQAAASVKSDVNVEKVEIIIDGSNLSKGDIAEAVADVLRNVGRNARNPAPNRD